MIETYLAPLESPTFNIHSSKPNAREKEMASSEGTF